MKIGILTFHASHNYGSMLQAYAMQCILKNMGHESQIINLRNKAQLYLYMQPLQWKHPGDIFRKLTRQPFSYLALQRKYKYFETFIANILNTSTNICSTKEDVNTCIKHEHYDAVLVGSDQIWNPSCVDFDESYFLPFSGAYKKIAYAPSLGPQPEHIKDAQQILFKKYISDFTALSTREQRGADFIQSLTGRKAEVVLDPTLLLDAKDYNPLINKKPIVTGQYIFYYSPVDEPPIFEKAKILSQRTGLPIVITQMRDFYKGANIHFVRSCGPCEYLNILKNATCSIGKSFHLLAFSILFQKEFIMITGDTDSRLMNILQPLGLSNRALNIDSNEITIESEINYEEVFIKLAQLRRKSLEYLKNSLQSSQ